jgi:triphosphatase
LLAAGESDLRRLARLTQLGRYELRPRDVQRLRSVYVDTPGLALARHGMALRVRRNGERWEATAKWGGTVAGDVHERAELTTSLAGAPRMPFELPSGPLALQLTALVAGRPLRPILITDIHRRRIDVVAADGGAQPKTIAELALDRVVLRAPGKTQNRDRYYEVEVELRQGTRRNLAQIVRRLRNHCQLRPSTESKLTRGLRLFHDTPPVAAPVRVSSDDTVESAARKTVARHFDRLRRHDPGTRIGKDPEAVHDMRVATRRLRAALRAFKPGFRKAFRSYLREELTWLARQLGGVRDLDVQLDTLERFCNDLGDAERAALEPYRTHLQTGRRQHRLDLLSALISPRYFRLLVEIEAFTLGDARYRPHGRGAHEPVATMGRKAIRKTFRRLLKQGDAIAAAPTAADLHALRIRTKRARYLLEFLRDLIDRPGRRLIKRLVRLQDQLGAHQDAIVAVQTVRSYSESPDAPPDAELRRLLDLFTAMQLRRAEELRADFSATWRRFSQRRGRRDLKAAREQLRTGEIALRPSSGPAHGTN